MEKKKKRGNVKNLKPFKKGFDPNRNLKGAPKKLPLLKKLLEEVLGAKEGEDLSETKLAKIIEALTTTATKTNAYNQVNAAKELLERVFGKVPTSMIADDGEGVQVNINIKRNK